MTEHEPENPEDDSRRNFLKGTAAAGITATGLAAFTGTASAQNVRNLQIRDVSVSGGLLNISLQNTNVLRNVNVEDVVVTIIGGDVQVLQNFDDLVDIESITVSDLVDVNLENVLNNNDVLVSVAVLGESGNVLAAGDTIA